MTGLPRSGGAHRILLLLVGVLVGALVAPPAQAATPTTESTVVTESAGSVSTSAPSSWTFRGAGFGHGVGMSQYGARAQAEAGRSAAQILAFYYRGTTYDAVPDDQTIHVNVLHEATTAPLVGEATRSGGGTLTITAAGRTMRAPAGTTVTLSHTGNSVVARCSSPACSRSSVWGGSVRVVWDEYRSRIRLDGRRYAHAPFVITGTPGAAKLEGVFELRLADEYLDQIKEMPWSWPTAALQAQAAAARAYALRKVNAGRRADCACHVRDGVSDQVYAPLPVGDAYWSRWRTAVAAGGSSTTGYVPRYRGSVIEAFYSSSSSGRTVANEDVWPGGPLPYLRSVADPWSRTADNPRRSWTQTVSGRDLADAFGLPDVVQLDLGTRVSARTVGTATATSSAGVTRSIPGTELRRELGLSSTAVRRDAVRTNSGSSATLAATAARSAPTSARSVVIASMYEEDVAHLVMARPLAGALDAPLLLSGRHQLTSAAIGELDRRGARITHAYVVAGWPMVQQSVLNQLESRGITVERVGLSDKDATGAAIVDLLDARGTIAAAGVSTQATVDEAGAFGAPAALRGEPIVWAGPTKVGWRSRNALARAGVSRVRLLGPTARISAAVGSDLDARGYSVQRFGGPSTPAISASIADYFAWTLRGSEVVLARYSSSLRSHAVLAAGYGRPVLLVGGSAAGSVRAQAQRSPTWTRVRAFGSTSRVSSATLTTMRDA